MGRAISALDLVFNTGANRRLKGALSVAALALVAGLTGWLLQAFGPVVTVIVAAVLLAHRSLVDHVKAVATGLRQSDQAGRDAVAMIVSRDVSESTPSATSRSAIESLSENLSDGVIAPAFWFLVAGLPGIAVYKMVNTADSTVGYLTPRHADFGWASARLDDVLNWVPARLTGIMVASVGRATKHRAAIRADAALHRSPNAGWPEAAMAYTIDVALAGPRSYNGEVKDFAWVNGAARRDLTPNDIDVAIAIVWKAWGLAVIAMFGLGVLIWAF